MVSLDVWGPKLWTSIHYIALGYSSNPTEDERKNYRTFFMDLGNVIPCHKCSVNYKKHLKEIPINDYLSNNDRLFEWTVLIHNIVNKENGKKEYSVKEAKDYYLNDIKIEPSTKIDIVTAGVYTAISLVAIVLIAMVIAKRKSL